MSQNIAPHGVWVAADVTYVFLVCGIRACSWCSLRRPSPPPALRASGGVLTFTPLCRLFTRRRCIKLRRHWLRPAGLQMQIRPKNNHHENDHDHGHDHNHDHENYYRHDHHSIRLHTRQQVWLPKKKLTAAMQLLTVKNLSTAAADVLFARRNSQPAHQAIIAHAAQTAVMVELTGWGFHLVTRVNDGILPRTSLGPSSCLRG